LIYLDTSVLAAVFFREPTARAVAAALRAHAKDKLTISGWTLTEMASVAALKERTRVVSPDARDNALRAFHRFASTELHVVEVEAFDFRSAARLIEQVTNLRAGEALHLAIAHRLEARIATLDGRLAQAAAARGVAVLDLLPIDL
jgi:predicted nucleic acid-binding protein